MTTQEAIVAIIGKEKYNAQVEAGITDVEILKFACLIAFMGSLYSGEAEETLRNSLVSIWTQPPPYNFNFGIAS